MNHRVAEAAEKDIILSVFFVPLWFLLTSIYIMNHRAAEATEKDIILSLFFVPLWFIDQHPPTRNP